MKKVWVVICTLLFIGLINYLCTFTGMKFIDSSFFCGLLSTIIIHFFTSTGGFSSNQVRLQVQAQTGMKVEEEETSFHPSVAFYTAVAYTVVSLIAIIIYYKDYFI
ncbi:hypothetical protein JOC77_000822 [Peribacillus deserti]|uniref:DUF3899 domain-containing protein n=1 Tax=Peribacillus deserti TaxID=673318 RepID=A0ABS2QE24_9BACI|nr:hypothetical protein [Peribacillus deserti]MBM7691417.1 hypothetical protein [Peribacillus deserti]